MRFKLTLHLFKPGAILPINYHYPVSAWIYSRICSADIAFAEWLHENGYSLDSKHFKLFTFSELYLPKFERDGDRLKILTET